MPIIRDSPVTIFPAIGTKLCRYMDITKFLSLLSTKSLFFCRIDMLEDSYEGRTTKNNFMYRYTVLKYFGSGSVSSEEEVLKKVQEIYDYEQETREVTCVSCWNKFLHESAALWKIYSDFGKGIMVKTSIESISLAFQKSDSKILVSEVQYMDYLKEQMPDFNFIYPVIHKRNAYKFEDEVRLIYEVQEAQIGKKFEWESQPIREGVLIPVDIDLLIEEIIVGPFSPKWFRSLVEDICSKYGLSKMVSKSALV